MLSAADISAFENGFELKNGEKFAPAILEKGEGKTALVTVSEGKFHEVKRLFLLTGNAVLYLKRLKIGGLLLDTSLSAGESRALTTEEKDLIFSE